MAAKVKVTVYLSEDVLRQAKNEAMRQDRSLSWVIQYAWRESRTKLATFPTVEDHTPRPP